MVWRWWCRISLVRILLVVPTSCSVTAAEPRSRYSIGKTADSACGPEDEGKNCPHCDAPRPDLGFEDSEEIDYIPAKVVVKKHRRRKYGACLCRDFAEDESSPQVIIAPKPARLLPGSIASSGLLSSTTIRAPGPGISP